MKLNRNVIFIQNFSKNFIDFLLKNKKENRVSY